MKNMFLGFVVALSLVATCFAQDLYINPYPPAIDIIGAASSGARVPSPPVFSATSVGSGFFPFFLSYFESVYRPLERQGSILQSVDEDWRDPVSRNYASAIDQFLDLNTQDYENVQDAAVLTTLDGRQVKIDRIYTPDADAIFSGETRIPLSELTPESQALARGIIKNVLFDKTVRISVDRNYSDTKEWRPFGELGSGFRIEHDSYVFVVEIENNSDLSLENLILEYQIFFRQSLAGTPLRANDYYRHVGIITIEELLSQQQHLALRMAEDRDVVDTFPDRRLSDREESVREKLGIFTITPPPLSTGEYQQKRRQFISSTGELITSIASRPFPNDFNQDFDARMLGIWIRLHRITPLGYVKVEYKDNVYPQKTAWDNVRGQLGQFR
jgi:hypothetical protein